MLGTQLLYAQTYTFDRIVEKQQYMTGTLPVSDTMINGAIILDGVTLTITTENRVNIVIHPVILMDFDQETGLQSYFNNGNMYFLNLESEEFIVVKIGYRTVYNITWGL